MALKICVGITGSIAAYRSPDFIKELVARGHEVRAVLTQGGQEFVSSRVLETFSGNPVLATNPFADTHFGTDHIALARWADVFVIFGATADFMARYALGLADDFLCLQLVATNRPVVVAPAMNPVMWEHPSVRTNHQTLLSRGVLFSGPTHGKVACGEVGLGHIAEIAEIVRAVENATKISGDRRAGQPLAGRQVLISVGPMRSPLDSVRFIQNRSSGRMGLELAREARQLGASVEILLGPVEFAMGACFADFGVHPFENPTQYEKALDARLPAADYFLSAAAVLDFEADPVAGKIERSALPGGTLTVPYRSVPDFVGQAGAKRRKPGQKIIAFAAEAGTDEQIVQRASEKMLRKKVDLMIANPVRPGLGPEAADNEIWILREGRAPVHIGPRPKAALAGPIFQAILGQL